MDTIINVENLTKYYGPLKAVDDLSLSVKRGEVYGLLGANGAGKSTTIECVLGTRQYDSGKITILGMDPIKDRKRLFEHVGVQFQESNYQEKITVAELCKVTQSLYKEASDYNELLEQFHLVDKKKSMISELSGGQKQRLFIVLALIANPEVVFLDELTTGLDTRARRDVWSCLTSMKENGLTVFLTSHYMDEVEALCDNLTILNNGKTIFQGTVEEAIRQSPCERFEDAYLWYTEKEVC